MDKLDSWMNKLFGGKTPPSESNSNKEHPKNHNKKPFHKGEKSAHPARPAHPAHNSAHGSAQKPAHAHKRHSGVQHRRSHNGAQKPAHNAQHPQQQANRAKNGRGIKLQPHADQPTPITKGVLKIIPLGGLNEVGKNMMALEYEEDIIVLDMGLEFPTEDLLGIDYIIPDVTYLEQNKKRIRGVIITHGHLDHIGGIPYILPKLNFPPVYGTKLTMGLIEKKIKEFKQDKMAKLYAFDPKLAFKLGKFRINPFRVTHSIPDCVGFEVETPVGTIVHTGDFKFDDQPAGFHNDADLDKIAALGHKNVLALFSDSTNSLKKGTTMSEAEVGKTLEEIIMKTEGRLIIASFASVLGRIQQIIDYAQKHGRKVFVSGKSMMDNIDISQRLGYMNFPKGIIQDIKKYQGKTPDNETLILTTGSQGESVSALTRIANEDHSHIHIKAGDTVVLSSSPIVGNERAISSVINSLCKLGARVIHNKLRDVHTSGHGNQEDLKRMIQLVKPKFFLPVHGEYYMRQAHAELAIEECGIPRENVIMLENGSVLYARDGRVKVDENKIETKYILIDGLGEGHAGSQVQIDRQIMAQNGELTILLYVNRKTGALNRDPDVISRGFIYMHETEHIVKDIAEIAKTAYKNIMQKNRGAERKDIKRYIQQTVDKHCRQTLERRPLIVPILVEV